MNQEPERDLELTEALRRLEGDADLDEAGWKRLRASIASGAVRHFATPREPIAWWEYIAGWARPALPLAAAVGVLLLLLAQLDLGTNQQSDRGVDPSIVERDGLAMLVSGDVREQEAVSAIVGPGDRGQVVESVMGGAE